jgi:hypothetical protein
MDIKDIKEKIKYLRNIGMYKQRDKKGTNQAINNCCIANISLKIEEKCGENTLTPKKFYAINLPEYNTKMILNPNFLLKDTLIHLKKIIETVIDDAKWSHEKGIR